MSMTWRRVCSTSPVRTPHRPTLPPAGRDRRTRQIARPSMLPPRRYRPRTPLLHSSFARLAFISLRCHPDFPRRTAQSWERVALLARAEHCSKCALVFAKWGKRSTVNTRALPSASGLCAPSHTSIWHLPNRDRPRSSVLVSAARRRASAADVTKTQGGHSP
jgi:hypothetical protein